MRGDPATSAGRRLVPKLIAFGMRPSDICGPRHHCWRDRNGPLDYLQIESAVKDLGGYLIEGQPKTGKRAQRIFPFVAEELERIYQLQGCPALDALVIPNTKGGPLASSSICATTRKQTCSRPFCKSEQQRSGR